MEVFSSLGIDWRLLLIQIINFGILIFVLKKLLYKPVLDILEKRRKDVHESMTVAQRAKEEFEEFKAQKETELTNAKREAKEIVAAANRQASAIEETAKEKASSVAKQKLEEAHGIIKEEQRRMIESVKEQLVGLVVTATEKVVGKKLKDKDEAESLVKRSIERKP